MCVADAIQLGFRARTIDFTEHLVFEPSLKKSHELKVGTEMLQQQVRHAPTALESPS